MSTTISDPTLPMCAMPPLPVRRFTVDEYHRMIESGVLQENEPLELLEGWLVPKMTRKPPHDVAVVLVSDALRTRIAQEYHLRIQCAETTSDSEPEPDIAVVSGVARDYTLRHPGPRETALVIEIADSSLSRDRTVKARVYARAGIPVYWIVNLVDSQIEVYTAPTGPSDEPHYQSRRDFHAGDSVPLVIDSTELALIPARDLLP
jgi:Uma2 family endonuclease